jgi:hypothetical protein
LVLVLNAGKALGQTVLLVMENLGGLSQLVESPIGLDLVAGIEDPIGGVGSFLHAKRTRTLLGELVLK